MPKPVQPGGVPLWVSGRMNDKVIERIVRFGSGWIPWGDEARSPASHVARIRDALEAAGRDPKGFEVEGSLPTVRGGDGAIDVERTMENLPPLIAAGITDFRAQVRVPDERAQAEDQLAPLVAAFRETVGRA
jgi:alkanesulfonate monooxygenase SsuD/methylene tetrahydromethanopterin reductase-like flavin-dependent oxidoreductase (luciferase family)